MKTKYLVIHSLCFILLIYFLAPVSIEYFNYKTITTTYLPHFLSGFPEPRIFIIERPELTKVRSYESLGLPTLRQSARIDQSQLNVSILSSQDNVSIYEALIPKFHSPNVDYRIWLYVSPDGIEPSYMLGAEQQRMAQRYQMLINYDMTNDFYLMKFHSLQTSTDISAQIYGSLSPPHGDCVSNCVRIRFNKHTFFIDDDVPRLQYLNSITMIHIPNIKFSFSTFVILFLGIIGLFSDVTAINVSEAIISTVYRLFSRCKGSGIDASAMSPIFLLYQYMIYFVLGILCLCHIIHITIVHQQYDIQSTLNEGLAPTEYSDITAKICVKHKCNNSTLNKLTESQQIAMVASTISNFRVQNCSNPVKYSLTDESFVCIESFGYHNCSESSVLDLMTIDFEVEELRLKIEKPWDIVFYDPSIDKRMDIRLSINPTNKGSFFPSPTVRIRDGKDTSQYLMLYFRSEFLEYPYKTKCSDHFRGRNQLKCTEEKYIKRGREVKGGENLRIIASATASIVIKVSPTMTFLDYISCISTLLGFWLGLSMIGTAEILIGLCCTRKILRLSGKILIWTVLSILLSYFIVSRFQEYFQYDVSSDLRFSNSPNGMNMPPLTLYTRCETKSDGSWWPNETGNQHSARNPRWWMEYPNKSCSLYNLCQHMISSSIVNMEGRKSKHLVVRCYITETTFQTASLRIDDSIGTWDSNNQKYILIPMDYQPKSGCIVHGFEHSSESVVSKGDKDDFWYENVFAYQSNSHAFLDNHKVLLEYSYSKLLEPPYNTGCQEHPDPETYRKSWYHCWINRTMYYGMMTRKIMTSCDTGAPTYDMARLDDEAPDVEKAKDQCIKEENLRRPCKTWSSQISYPIKDKNSFPGNIVLEPASTVTYILTPKIRSVDFFILLFDQIGFWLGFNVIFICLISVQAIKNFYRYILRKTHIGNDADINQDIHIGDDTKYSYAGRRMNALKHWNKYSKIRKTMNAVTNLPMTIRTKRHRRSSSIDIINSTKKISVIRMVKTAPVTRKQYE